MEKIVHELYIYSTSTMYKLPENKISNNEWNVLFDEMYALFTSKGIQDSFYSLIRQYFRICLAEVLVNKKI